MPTLLERTIPIYHFHEVHTRWIQAAPTQVWQALSTLCLDQLTVSRLLVALRHLGTRPPSAGKPLFTDGPARMLETTAPTYAVGGAVARPWQQHPERREVTSLDEFAGFEEPGWTKFLTDFHLEPCDGGVQLTTETRGYSTDDRARRRFALYWALIRPASGLVRRDMLVTISRLATRPSS